MVLAFTPECIYFCFPGKVWFIVMVFLRISILLFAGYPLYQDEQERFVCNTIQPGCANVCYDLFAPISLFRFWLVQITALCLPYVIFVVYVVHRVSGDLTVGRDSVVHPAKAPIYEEEPLGVVPSADRDCARCFIGAYVLQLVSRTLLEAAFSAAHYYFFGFYVPRRFLCQHAPCTTQMDCYISRPTEKTVMLNFMLGLAALSLLLNILDFISTIRRSVMKRSKRKAMVKRRSHDEDQCLLSAGGPTNAKDSNIPDAQRGLAAEAGKTESFRKRQGSKSSRGGDAPTSGQNSPSLKGSTFPLGSARPQGCNTNGNNGYSAPQEEPPGVNGSEVVLCPPEPLGTPRSIRVNKRCGLKPPPPPRRDFLTSGTAPGGPTGDLSTICTRRVGQYTLVELTSSAQLRANDDGQEKRSEWV